MAASTSARQLAWALFDTIVADAEAAEREAPWYLAPDGELHYAPDFATLERLLGVPVALRANSQSGVPALALDVWLAYELRRAGFDRDAVWPRPTAPRILPGPIARLLENAKGDRAVIENRIRLAGSKGITASSAEVLGKNYRKQVDVVISDWSTGPEVLISTKRMDSSFGKNAANRVEESYGDAKNLRLRHPQAALGFVYGLNSTILEKEPKKAAWLVDLLAKLGREEDAYDAVALLLMDFEQEPPTDSSDGDEYGGLVLDDEGDSSQVPRSEVEDHLTHLPGVRILRDAPDALRHTPFDSLAPSRFLTTMINRVLDNSPVDYHERARELRSRPAE